MIAVTAFPTRDLLMRESASRIANALKQGISERGEGYAALSGGSTPEPAYAALATLDLDWSRVTFLLVDERFVPPTDISSNEKMLRRALAPAFAAGAKLLPMYSDGVSLDDAAARSDATYADAPIDIAVMGVGGDGHTASWFPQSQQLPAALDLDNARSVIAVTAAGAAGSAERLTLTRSALARATQIDVLITGDKKRALLEDAGRAGLPVNCLISLPLGVTVLWAP
jgi:6-phosphogluconolactonase